MTTRAVIYVRQSIDNTEGIERQLDRCRALVAARGWVVVAEYQDNAVSASKSRDRAQWGQVLKLARAGEFDVLVATKLDRIARRVQDVVELQDIGLQIATADQDIDTTTAQGRFQTQLLASLAELEVGRKGERHLDANRARAEKGIPIVKKRPYGWKADGITLEPIEAEHLRTAIRNVVAGGSFYAECRRMNDAGERTPLRATGSGGALWTPRVLSVLLSRPRIAGINVYKGVETGRSVIEPLVSRDEWEEFRAVVADPSRLTRRPGRTSLTNWAAGIARCSCGQLLGSGTIHRPGKGTDRQYICRDRPNPGGQHVAITADTLERVITNHVFVQLVARRGEVTGDSALRDLRLKRAAALEVIERATATELTGRSDAARRAAAKVGREAEQEAEALTREIDALLAAGTVEDWAEIAATYLGDSDAREIDANLAFDQRWAETDVERKREIARQLLYVEVLPFLAERKVVRMVDGKPAVVTVKAKGAERVIVSPKR